MSKKKRGFGTINNSQRRRTGPINYFKFIQTSSPPREKSLKKSDSPLRQWTNMWLKEQEKLKEQEMTKKR